MLYYLSPDSLIINFWRKQGRFKMFLDKNTDKHNMLVLEESFSNEDGGTNPMVMVLDEGMGGGVVCTYTVCV
jgi:hypothetical protein